MSAPTGLRDFPLSSMGGGLRYDSERGASRLTFDVGGQRARFTEELNEPQFAPPYTSLKRGERNNMSAHVLGRWELSHSDGSVFSLQSFYNRSDRFEVGSKERRDTLDLEAQQQFRANGGHRVSIGTGYRTTSDVFVGTNRIRLNPAQKTDRLWSLFANDEITLRDKLNLVFGGKIERNSYTGTEFLPSARIAWTPDPHRTLWGGVSRGVKNPARAERDLDVLFHIEPSTEGPITAIKLLGGMSSDTESVKSYEAGFRIQPSDKSMIDMAAFYNFHRNMRSFAQGQPAFSMDPVPHVQVPLYFSSNQQGRAFGLEIAAKFKPAANWSLGMGYSWLRTKVDLQPPLLHDQGNAPEHTFSLYSFLELPRRFQLNTLLYAVGPIADLGVPGYVRLDVNLGKQVTDLAHFSVGVKNLLNERHREFGPYFAPTAPHSVERSFYGKFSWRC